MSITKQLLRYTTLFFVAVIILSSLSSCSGNDYPNDSEDTINDRTFVRKDPGEVTLCIDPGHGFVDIGAQSELIEQDEKSINLTFAFILKSELEYRGYNVFLTHDGNSFPKTDKDNGDGKYDTAERTDYANSVGADYFISIHCNTYIGNDAESVRGARIYYSADAQFDVDEVARAADDLCMAIRNEFPDWREPKSYKTPANDSYYVTHWTEACSLLLELGFMTSPEDARDLINERWHQSMAKAVADGIDLYFSGK